MLGHMTIKSDWYVSLYCSVDSKILSLDLQGKKDIQAVEFTLMVWILHSE